MKDRVAAVVDHAPWALQTARLELVPLVREHAPEMFAVLGDRTLYDYTGGNPPSTVEGLARHFERLETRRSPDGSELWLNWLVEERASGRAVGYVQATVADKQADVAWVIGIPWQRQGYASEGAAAIVAWLRGLGVGRFRACVKPTHVASQRVAASLGMRRTDQWIDGEEVWVLVVADPSAKGEA